MMINLFENFRNVVHDGKAKPISDVVDVNSNSTEVPSSNLVNTPSSSPTTASPASSTLSSLTKAHQKLGEQVKLRSRTVTDFAETAISDDGNRSDDVNDKNDSNSHHAIRAKKVVELSVATATGSPLHPEPLKSVDEERANENYDENCEDSVENEDEDDKKSSGSASTTSLLSKSSSHSSVSTSSYEDRRRSGRNLDSASSKTRVVCDTCEDPKAPVHCATCRHAFCKRCSVTPSPAGQPWSCFLCLLEATKTPSTRVNNDVDDDGRRVRRLRSGMKRSGTPPTPSTLPPPAKRRRSQRVSRSDSSHSTSSSTGSGEDNVVKSRVE